MKCRTPVLLLLLACWISFGRAGEDNLPLAGMWKLLVSGSSDLATWRSRLPEVHISGSVDDLLIRYLWKEGPTVTLVDSLRILPGGRASTTTVSTAIWPDNWYMGVLARPGTEKITSGTWRDGTTVLETRTRQELNASQGRVVLETVRTFRLEAGGNRLTVTEQRSTRPTPILMTFERIAQP